MDRISVSIFAADNNLTRYEIHDAIHRGRLNSTSEPLNKKGYGGQRKVAYVLIDEKVPPYLDHMKEVKLRAKKKSLKVLVLKSGLEVLPNAFGKFMCFGDVLVRGE